MKRLQTLLARCLVLALAVCLVTFVPATWAVVKDLSIVDGEGKSLANTKVTIVFPDGTEVDEETDDDGMLYYDFPEDGEYMIRYPGGQMAVNVGGGGGGMSTGKMIGAGAAAVAIIGIGVAASDSGRDSDSSSSSSSSSSPGGSTGGSDPGGSSGSSSFDASVCNAVTYSVTTTVESDPGGHAAFDTFDANYEIFCNSGPTQATIVSQAGSGPSPNWSCDIGTGGDCISFQAICGWSGGTPTVCTLDSNFSASAPGWSGTMTVGEDGALPGGQPAVFSFVGVRQ
jgi:hypothetical protein